jgi:serine protease Do
MRERPWLYILVLFSVLVSGFLLYERVTPGVRTTTIRVDTSPPVERNAVLTTSFASTIRDATASVVFVSTTRMVRERRGWLLDDPIFRHFFGPGLGRERMERGLGSGVVVTEDGFILTNHHVIAGADQIMVSFANGHEQFRAQVVGTDPQTDIAVLKIRASGLPAVTIGDSDHLEVGDLVLAIGNPFGVGQTVTMGIVSAMGRGFGLLDYEDFIQTDASINPGNSGGALVDAQGRVVGINTAILSESGSHQGIGFAVPMNIARVVMERIIQEGRMIRGFIGLSLRPTTPDLGRGDQINGGALVEGVVERSPADQAGMRPGDLIVEFNEKPVANPRQFRLMVAQTRPGTEVNLKVLRNGREQSFTVVLQEMPSDLRAQAPSPQGSGGDPVFDGVEFTDLNNRLRREFGIPGNVQGAFVVQIAKGTPAFEAGLHPGHVIIEFERHPVRSVQDLQALAARFGGQRALVRTWTPNGNEYLLINVNRR